ncbi:MAG: o-succinylbenzoate synthase [Synechococcaceae cyanobacterium]
MAAPASEPAPPPAGACLGLAWRPFRLTLPRPLHTARGPIAEKRGWLLRLRAPGGGLGWGEAAPLDGVLEPLAVAMAGLGGLAERQALEQSLPDLPPALGFALGAALAELDGLPRRRWLPPPPPALLLPGGEAALEVLGAALSAGWAPGSGNGSLPFTCKWKVATADDRLERRLLERLLLRLPPGSRLRLDANGGWDRPTAFAWAERLQRECRLEWIEQPLDPHDQEGLAALLRRCPGLPVALDEALQCHPGLRERWDGWQVRRPGQEGDPRPLLAELERGRPRLMLSTGFETGIGRRWLHHLAALQIEGPTPVAPGLAPAWQAAGDLGSTDPERVWRAAGQGGEAPLEPNGEGTGP